MAEHTYSLETLNVTSVSPYHYTADYQQHSDNNEDAGFRCDNCDDGDREDDVDMLNADTYNKRK
jgi:hypothetical protein